jgi:hypothetical protein
MTCATCSGLELKIDRAARYHDHILKVNNQKRLHAHQREAHPS